MLFELCAAENSEGVFGVRAEAKQVGDEGQKGGGGKEVNIWPFFPIFG